MPHSTQDSRQAVDTAGAQSPERTLYPPVAASLHEAQPERWRARLSA